MKPKRRRINAYNKRQKARSSQSQASIGKMQIPMQNYQDMIGWPGTIPPSRMRIMIDALHTGQAPQGEHILVDLAMLIEAQDCLKLSAQIPDEIKTATEAALSRKADSQLSLETLTTTAWMQDTISTIGGIISTSSNNGRTEHHILFKLLRDPDWIGFNRMLPSLRGMNAIISESRKMPGRPGIISAEPKENRLPTGTTTDFPAGEAELLAKVLRWHKVTDVRWRPQNAKTEPISRYNR